MIGAFKNLWRSRSVVIYEHPTAPATRVITCGAPLDLLGTPTAGDHIWTDEPRENFARYIGTFNQVFE
jgi:hypothetical protein